MDSAEKKNILVVDDDMEIVRAIALNLESEGYTVFKAYDGMEALDLAMTKDIHLIIIDVMMPRLDGLSAIMKIREKKNLPIIVLSAKSENSDKVIGLSMGADDYITKPFSVRELMARVKAHIRRVALIRQSAGNQEDRLDFGRLVIHKESAQATKDGERLELTQREFELLTYLASHAGRVFSRQELMERVWNYEGYVGDVRGVDVAVRRLREKLEDDPAQPKYIITRRGAGYYFQKDL